MSRSLRDGKETEAEREKTEAGSEFKRKDGRMKIRGRKRRRFEGLQKEGRKEKKYRVEEI